MTNGSTDDAREEVATEIGLPTGQIVIRLSLNETIDVDDLQQLASHHRLLNLAGYLAESKTPATRVIHNIPAERLRKWEALAANTRFPPLHSLTAYWRLDLPDEDDQAEFFARLRAMTRDNEVNLAYHEAEVRQPNTPTPVPTNQLTQDYLNPAPKGIHAQWAWDQTNGKGENVKVIDLESGWILTHEDLPDPKLLFNQNRDNQYGRRDHGAAVLGIIGAREDSAGVTGIAPNLTSLGAVSHYELNTNTNYHVAAAIVSAREYLERGDVLLLEVQRFPNNSQWGYPTEILSSDLDAIRLAVASGIIVVEAGGNGNQNLDNWNGTHSLNRNSSNFVDSGAILVGAAKSLVIGSGASAGHDRESDSNYGNRVDCYAWGDKITTTGYGSAGGVSGGDNSFTNNFNSTSGASAIIAGVAAVVQSWSKARCRKPITPFNMRWLLSRASKGTPQTDSAAGPIGVMPDLKRILAWKFRIRLFWWCWRERLRNFMSIFYRPGG